jgi:hypothetical protein
MNRIREGSLQCAPAVGRSLRGVYRLTVWSKKSLMFVASVKERRDRTIIGTNNKSNERYSVQIQTSLRMLMHRIAAVCGNAHRCPAESLFLRVKHPIANAQPNHFQSTSQRVSALESWNPTANFKKAVKGETRICFVDAPNWAGITGLMQPARQLAGHLPPLNLVLPTVCTRINRQGKLKL